MESSPPNCLKIDTTSWCPLSNASSVGVFPSLSLKAFAGFIRFILVPYTQITPYRKFASMPHVVKSSRHARATASSSCDTAMCTGPPTSAGSSGRRFTSMFGDFMHSSTELEHEILRVAV